MDGAEIWVRILIIFFAFVACYLLFFVFVFGCGVYLVAFFLCLCFSFVSGEGEKTNNDGRVDERILRRYANPTLRFSSDEEDVQEDVARPGCSVWGSRSVPVAPLPDWRKSFLARPVSDVVRAYRRQLHSLPASDFKLTASRLDALRLDEGESEAPPKKKKCLSLDDYKARVMGAVAVGEGVEQAAAPAAAVEVAPDDVVEIVPDAVVEIVPAAAVEIVPAAAPAATPKRLAVRSEIDWRQKVDWHRDRVARQKVNKKKGNGEKGQKGNKSKKKNKIGRKRGDRKHGMKGKSRREEWKNRDCRRN